MLFMVVEHFRPGQLELVAERFRNEGRLLPAGVEYVDSWMATDGATCYQIMNAESREALDRWIARWEDLVEFSVTPVMSSADYWARN